MSKQLRFNSDNWYGRDKYAWVRRHGVERSRVGWARWATSERTPRRRKEHYAYLRASRRLGCCSDIRAVMLRSRPFADIMGR